MPKKIKTVKKPILKKKIKQKQKQSQNIHITIDQSKRTNPRQPTQTQPKQPVFNSPSVVYVPQPQQQAIQQPQIIQMPAATPAAAPPISITTTAPPISISMPTTAYERRQTNEDTKALIDNFTSAQNNTQLSTQNAFDTHLNNYNSNNNTRFDRIENNYNDISTKLNEIYGYVDTQNRNLFDGLKQYDSVITKRFNEYGNRINNFQERTDALYGNRIRDLEERVDELDEEYRTPKEDIPQNKTDGSFTTFAQNIFNSYPVAEKEVIPVIPTPQKEVMPIISTPQTKIIPEEGKPILTPEEQEIMANIRKSGRETAMVMYEHLYDKKPDMTNIDNYIKYIETKVKPTPSRYQLYLEAPIQTPKPIQPSPPQPKPVTIMSSENSTYNTPKLTTDVETSSQFETAKLTPNVESPLIETNLFNTTESPIKATEPEQTITNEPDVFVEDVEETKNEPIVIEKQKEEEQKPQFNPTDNDGKFVCRYCKGTFPFAQGLVAHLRALHTGDGKPHYNQKSKTYTDTYQKKVIEAYASKINKFRSNQYKVDAQSAKVDAALKQTEDEAAKLFENINKSLGKK